MSNFSGIVGLRIATQICSDSLDTLVERLLDSSANIVGLACLDLQNIYRICIYLLIHQNAHIKLFESQQVKSN